MDAQTLAGQLWDAARDSIVGDGPVVHTGRYACFVVLAEALVPVLQRLGRLPCAAAGASAIDVLLSGAKRNLELTSVALVSIDELLSAGICDGHVKPLALRSLDGVQRPSVKIALRKCMVGRRGTSLMALSSRLEKFQQGAICAAPRPKAPHTSPGRLPIIFDMETEDPDDVLTLLFLAAHAAVDLKAVTVTPGSYFQVSLIRWLLQEVGLSGVRVGAQDWPKNKNAPAPRGRFYDNFKHFPTKDSDCEDASQVLLECCDESTTLLTGGPLTNLAAALSHDAFKLGRWVAQGGFAGEGVVPSNIETPFRGMTYCRTTNFGSDPRAAHRALRSKSIGRRVCVSKNVCHRTLYADGADGWHGAVLAALRATRGRPGRRSALELMHKAMSNYLARTGGKKIHDPLALATALDESVCTLCEVELGSCGPKDEQWGCWPRQGSGTWISVDYSEAKFRTTLLQDGSVPWSSIQASAPEVERQPDAQDEAVAGGLGSDEKEVLKLAKKLRGIMKLEERKAGGAALDSNQQRSIDSKKHVTAQFLDAVETLPAVSDVLAKVSDLMPAVQQVADNQDGASAGDALPGMQQLACNQDDAAAAAQGGASDDTPQGNDTEPQKEGAEAQGNTAEPSKDLAKAQVGDGSADSKRSWRPRGGRSGHSRRYDAKRSP